MLDGDGAVGVWRWPRVQRRETQLNELVTDKACMLPIFNAFFGSSDSPLDRAYASAYERRGERISLRSRSPEQRRERRRQIPDNHLDTRVFDALGQTTDEGRFAGSYFS